MNKTLITALCTAAFAGAAHAGETPVILYSIDATMGPTVRNDDLMAPVKMGATATTGTLADIVTQQGATIPTGNRADLAALLAQLDAEMAARGMAGQ